jgi:predicted nucleic acid-binding Zn ribbon protein
MQRKNTQPLSEVLSTFFEHNRLLKSKLAEHRVVTAWREMLGESISYYSKNVYFSRNTLYVQLTSAVLRAELLINKEELIKKLNDYAGVKVVKDIVFR